MFVGMAVTSVINALSWNLTTIRSLRRNKGFNNSHPLCDEERMYMKERKGLATY